MTSTVGLYLPFSAERVGFALALPLAAASFLAEKNKNLHSSKLGSAFYFFLRKEWDSNPQEKKMTSTVGFALAFFCGKSGIQTHGTVEPYAGFRVRSIRSLWHLSL